MTKSFFIILFLAFFLFGCVSKPVTKTIVPSVSPSASPAVPLPTQEDTIRLFYNLINEHRIPEAIAMMSPRLVADDSAKQAWGVQFNDIRSIKVLDIQPGLADNSFKVILEVSVNSEAASLPIPYYGYEDNPNFRWLDLIKVDGRWLIDSINTGP